MAKRKPSFFVIASPTSQFAMFYLLFINTKLSTFLTVAVCRTGVTYEPYNTVTASEHGTRKPQKALQFPLKFSTVFKRPPNSFFFP